MTTQEFSNTFDTLLNSYNTLAVFGEQASKADVVLDEYEKSVLLTLALDIVVKSFFTRQLNSQGEGFDDSTRRLVDFSALITVETPTVDTTGREAYDERGIIYKMPTDKPILLMLNEKITVYLDENHTKTKSYVVVPINYKEYDRQMSKAYTLPLKKQCWRLFQGGDGVDIYSEIIPIEGTTIDSYKIRYIRRPRPIILTNLDFADLEPLDIDGHSTVSECELNPILHMEILLKAVELALSTRGRMQPAKNQDNE